MTKTVSNLVIASILSVSGAVYAQSAADTAKPAKNPPGAIEKTSAAEVAKAKAAHTKLPSTVEKTENKTKAVQPMAATKIDQTKAGAHKVEVKSKEQHVAKTPEMKTPEQASKPAHKAEAMVAKTPAK